jgi:N-acetylglucosaminyldiphosphoundecaprenol N-acetyl-beta-D-mannosaminyltransferase
MTKNSFIFNTRVDNLARQDIVQTVDIFLKSDSFHQIATMNPEFLLLSRTDTAFREILNRCELNVADGVGLHLALWRQGKILRARVTGADLTTYILQQAENKQLEVLCVVRKDGLSAWKDIRRALKKRYPKLQVEGIDTAPTTSIGMLRTETQQRINDAHIVLCNFGIPYQELFLSGLRNNPGSIRVAMGVGGSFDFLTGKIRRAPQWMRAIGLEWLWRLLLQPKRFTRIWNALIVFPIQILFTPARYNKKP